MTGKDLWYKPKLIEVALPLEAINSACRDEKAVPRKGHPATLHLWWARRPLAACRAVLFGQLVDDPSAHPEKFPTEEQQDAERKRLHDMLSELVKWENTNNEHLLSAAREEIRKSCNGSPPPIIDPFAGGGSIPLEAQRLGLEAHASDLNPVAVLINKVLIEIPPELAGRSPMFSGAADEAHAWPGATGLAEDVRRYGQWIRDEAERRIGYLYPKIRMSDVEVPIIAWMWARTVTCPNPLCGGTMPLVSSFWLSKKKGKERFVVPIPEGKRVRFEISGPGGGPREGTVSRTGAVCLICGTPVQLSYIRAEGQAGRMGAQLMAIAAEGKRQRYYICPSDEQEKAANVARPEDVPDTEIPYNPRYMTAPGYGMRTWADLFTNRQLHALTTFSNLVQEVRGRVLADGGEDAYADAIATYLSFAISKLADWSSSFCSWINTAEKVRNTFTRQAISMVWDFLEIFPFSNTVGNFSTHVDWVASCIREAPASERATARQADAKLVSTKQMVIATDPPYYDNVGYADLSDFFYVWLRRSLNSVYPSLMSTVLTPKKDELVADPIRHPGKGVAERFFESGFEQVFERILSETPAEFPVTVFYAFKQAENDDAGGHASTGWERLLEGMLRGGWTVTATWPVRTERSSRTRAIEANALASSIVLTCRPRPADAGATDRRGLIAALREEFPNPLRKLEQAKVAPVDLRQAAIGPGMAVFSRYRRVNEPDGSPMRIRAALSLINQVLDEKLSQLEGDVSADSRFCVEWFKQFGFEPGPFGTAETLSRGIDTSVEGLERAGVLRSRAGKVKLLAVRELPESYDPADDDRTSEWEICLHLAKRLEEQGADAAAQLMAAARDAGMLDLDDVQELAYFLYSIAEKKDWAETALLFNNLGTSWTDLEDASRKITGPVPVQGHMEFGGDDGDE